MQFRGCYSIDTTEFLTSEPIVSMSLAEIGRTILDINAAYRRGDFGYLRQFNFIKAIYPHHKKRGCREHIPKRIRDEVLAIGHCLKCGTTERLTVDHIVPVSRGGSSRRSNLQPLCFQCNVRKGNRL